MSKSEIVHFSITGEFITKQARDFWNLEGEHERAMELLGCLDGITEGQCLDVLEGRAKLTGDSGVGIDLAADNAENCKTLKQVLGRLKEERDEARDEAQDFVQMAIGDTVSLASPTGLRRVPRRKTTEISGKRTLRDGYEFDDIARTNDKPLKIWQQDPEYRAPIDRRSGTPGAGLSYFKPEPVPPLPEASITSDTGWLAPDGKFYPCQYAQHGAVAVVVGFEPNDQGYVRLCVIDNTQWFFGDNESFTNVQKEMIRTYCKERKIDLPYWLKET